MSQSSDALTPPAGVSEAEFNRLLAQGRARRGRSVDDVMAGLEHVELTEDLIDGVRKRLSDEGIHLDEGDVEVNGAELLPPEEPRPVGAAATGFAVPLPAPAPAGSGDAPFLPAPPTPPAVATPARAPRREAESDDGAGRPDGGRGARPTPSART